MFRSRRQKREIPFSFDSFLDVVANVVGIIIRLILVAWVGARSYNSLQLLSKPAPAGAEKAASTSPEPADPLQEELARHRQEFAQVQARLLEQLRQLEGTKGGHLKLEQQLAGLKDQEVGLDRQQADLEHQAAEGDQTTHTVALSLADLQKRRQKLTEDMQALEKLPPLGRTLHYRTPVSQPVHADEFLFECRAGRVTFVDMTSLVEEIRQSLEDKKQELRTRWEVSDTTPPVGAFRLRYVLERERGLLEGALPDAPPSQDESFNLSLSGWVVEPVVQVRGETLAQALAPGSDFRQIVDRIDPQFGVVTFWVYPESFALFRQLRDYLYERDLVVAGRPLPEGFPMTFSRNGSVSRGQ